MRIQKLSHDVVDQIAAGEVLERPANMIKEFIENSVDAGATELEVDVEGGGRQVVIKDNGQGIHKDDIALSLERHATSKISKSSDLWGLSSFGFRGEALASIAAVSQLKIVSRHQDSEQAFEVNSDFGVKSEPLEGSRGVGTSIFVKELFSSVPARLKFLKSDTAETTAIKKMIKAFSLSYPNISVRLRVSGKLVCYFAPSETDVARAQQVLDRKKMYKGESELGLLSAKVIYSAPNEVARNSQNMWFFVQNRWIQDRSLQAAVMAGFENTLMHGEYPICAVWIECDPQEVDVNVHPTKSQVKFRDPRSAFKVVREAILKSVAKAPWLADMLPDDSLSQVPLKKVHERQELKPSLGFSDSQLARTQYQIKSTSREDATASEAAPRASNDRALDILKSYASPKDKGLQAQVSTDLGGTISVAYPAASESFYADRSSTTHLNSSEVSSNPGEKPVRTNFQNNTNDDVFSTKHHWSKLQVLGQADNCYIVAQSSRSLILVDQHAAHERVAFERIMKAWDGGGVEIQDYLLPLLVNLEEEEVEALLTVSDELLKLGIKLERSGPEELAISSAPSFLKEKALVKAFYKLATEVIKHGAGTAVESKLKDIAATMACHSVVRAGQALSISEMKALLEQMDEFPLSSFCPHGRPVFVEYPFAKIDKDFGRIV